MCEVDTEEVSALSEEIEGELLNIAFIHYEQKDTIEGVLSDILRYAVVEEESEYTGKQKVGCKGKGQFEEEKVKNYLKP